MILSAGIAVVTMTDDLMIPAPASLETRIHGVPEGCWYNFVQWSDDSKHISFTIRSAGTLPSCSDTLTQINACHPKTCQLLRTTGTMHPTFTALVAQAQAPVCECNANAW